MNPSQTEKQREQLKIISIFHYVAAGLCFAFSSFFIIHIVIGIMTLINPQAMAAHSTNPPPPFFGWVFVLTGSLMVLGGWTLTILLLFAGKFLNRRRHYTFCFIIAVISCVFVPFGTILGVFTIILLTRDPIKNSFEKVT